MNGKMMAAEKLPWSDVSELLRCDSPKVFEALGIFSNIQDLREDGMMTAHTLINAEEKQTMT